MKKGDIVFVVSNKKHDKKWLYGHVSGSETFGLVPARVLHKDPDENHVNEDGKPCECRYIRAPRPIGSMTRAKTCVRVYCSLCLLVKIPSTSVFFVDLVMNGPDKSKLTRKHSFP